MSPCFHAISPFSCFYTLITRFECKKHKKGGGSLKKGSNQDKHHMGSFGRWCLRIQWASKHCHSFWGPTYHPTRVNVVPLPRLGYLHVLCDIGVPKPRVIVVLPLMSSIITVRMSPRDALLDCCPPFMRTPLFRVFILLSTDLSVRSTKWAGVH